MRIVVFTSMTGCYDELLQPVVPSPNIDFVCVTDYIYKEQLGAWRFIRNPYSCSELKRLSVWARLHPHLLFPEYDYSLYIDANVHICSSEFYTYIEKAIDNNVLVAQVPHPTRDCIYQELEQCLNIRKVSPWQYIKHRCRYKKYGMPEHWGLYEDNVILRKHNSPDVIRISEMWWDEYRRISNRDQLCAMLVYWRLKFKPVDLLGEGENTRNSELIKCRKHSNNITSKKLSLFTRIRHFVERKTLLTLYRRIVGAEDYSSQW